MVRASARMFGRNEFADRLTAKGSEPHQHSEWTVKKTAGVSSFAMTAQRRVATVTLHMAEQYPNKSIQVSHVAVRRKRASLEECVKLSAQEIVAGAQARLREVHQVPTSMRQEAVACLDANHMRTVACEGCALHPFAAWVATSRPAAERFRQRRC